MRQPASYFLHIAAPLSHRPSNSSPSSVNRPDSIALPKRTISNSFNQRLGLSVLFGTPPTVPLFFPNLFRTHNPSHRSTPDHASNTACPTQQALRRQRRPQRPRPIFFLRMFRYPDRQSEPHSTCHGVLLAKKNLVTRITNPAPVQEDQATPYPNGQPESEVRKASEIRPVRFWALCPLRPGPSAFHTSDKCLGVAGIGHPCTPQVQRTQ
ncbi:hypothetical protein OF83DRAFT_331031 [Amylostereum chailletii]|nr:hypothetical protein OF83DRAFT_331031 [Amylostereum chailletii]